MAKDNAIQRQPNGQFAKGNKEGNRFSKTKQPNPKKVSEGRKKQIAQKKEIETSAQILIRCLNDEITNSKTGEQITQKEAMLLTLMSLGLKDKNLKAIEMILKIIGDFSEVPQSNLFINQPVKIDKAVIDKSIKEIMTLADE